MAYLESNNPDGTTTQLPLNAQTDRRSYLALDEDGRVHVTGSETWGALGVITPAKGRWVLASNRAGAVRVNGRAVAPLKVLMHNDRISLGELTLRFCAEVIETLAEDSAILRRRLRCPYTRELFKTGDRVVRCPDCNTPHAVLAWFEHKACGNPNCSYQAQMVGDGGEGGAADGA